ncbi:MAG: hypothetical protein KGL39_09100 [Patescibacteria group bacterium]|nr:hypothetical protein [Patescibacteria group bacterium]
MILATSIHDFSEQDEQTMRVCACGKHYDAISCEEAAALVAGEARP